MASSIVSTHEVAAMLNVTETTIKRWADESVLPCVRTPGGHRKFRLADIVRFAESRGYTVGGSRPPVMTANQRNRLEMGVHTQNYSLVSEVLYEEALQADREGLLKLLLYLYKHHIPVPVIADEVIRPAFDKIGVMWEDGRLEVNQEHAASQATLEAIVQLSADLHRKEANGMSAVCACLDGELHELGIRTFAYSLHCEGWKVHYLGANTPAETLELFIRTTRPYIACLSTTTSRNRGALEDQMQRITSLVHTYGGKMIVGGYYSGKLRVEKIKSDRIASSIVDAIDYTRDTFNLKPGPRRAKKSNH